MNEQHRTEIATLGEFGLIHRLTDDIKLINESTHYGVGDDCAVLSYPTDREILVTTHMLMEGVHFDLNHRNTILWDYDKLEELIKKMQADVDA